MGGWAFPPIFPLMTSGDPAALRQILGPRRRSLRTSPLSAPGEAPRTSAMSTWPCVPTHCRRSRPHTVGALPKTVAGRRIVSDRGGCSRPRLLRGPHALTGGPRLTPSLPWLLKTPPARGVLPGGVQGAFRRRYLGDRKGLEKTRNKQKGDPARARARREGPHRAADWDLLLSTERQQQNHRSSRRGRPPRSTPAGPLPRPPAPPPLPQLTVL